MEKEQTKTKKTCTLADLQEAERTRQESVAKFYEELARLEGERSEYKRAVAKASKNGDIDAAMEAQEQVVRCETRKSVISSVIEQADAERYYTDADCIEAANYEISLKNKSLTELVDRYETLCIELTTVARDLALLYQSTKLKAQEALNYHSANRDSTIINTGERERLYAKQGLKAIRPIPDLHIIKQLLAKQYGGNGEGICNISTGTIIPGFKA